MPEKKKVKDIYLDIEVKSFKGFINLPIDKEKDVNSMNIVQNPKILNNNYFIILLKPSEELYSLRADLLNYKIYNNLREYR